jgi:hypothetical protein
MLIEPENVSGDHSYRWKRGRFPAIGTAEHKALVAAIRLNFPEIYDNPICPPRGQEYREIPISSSVISPLASA